MRLDGYIRVSRIGGREGEGYISPDVQRDSIKSYAAELGGSIVTWHDDQDYSGDNTSARTSRQCWTASRPAKPTA